MNGTIRVRADQLNGEDVVFVWRTQHGHEIKEITIPVEETYVSGKYVREDSVIEEVVPLNSKSVEQKLEELTEEDGLYVCHDATIINNIKDDRFNYLWHPEFELEIRTADLVIEKI